jgi:hypothetical protein
MSERVRGERDWWKDKDEGERIILRWILERYTWVVWTGFIWLGKGRDTWRVPVIAVKELLTN